MTKNPYVLKTLRFIIETGFLALSLMMYAAFWLGLTRASHDILNHWYVILFVLVAYMWRLDFVAAIFGFYGAYDSGLLPEWQAAAVSIVFLFVSYYLDHGRGAAWIKQKARRQAKEDQPAPTQTKPVAHQESTEQGKS